MKETEYFTALELFLLCDAFEGKLLFGLPSRDSFDVLGEVIYKEAFERLIKKGIISHEHQITNEGAFVISMLEDYYSSDKYIRINQFMLGFNERDPTQVVFLSEREEYEEQYDLGVMSTNVVMETIKERFPTMLGNQQDATEDLFKEPISKKEVGEHLDDVDLLNIEIFNIKEKLRNINNAAFYKQLLIFESKGKLIMADVVKKIYERVSPYYIYSMLAKELGIKGEELQWK
ncbi:hypothetical protein A374_01414 [Fictibacillus macauensis ZFHKF-1]|uniref:Uncharacterized protein n=1 Tax=Fictibacillus macauensis ZFHKF-1 TaxID=1196324 RepID=I8AN71_9BACL|nr:DUF5081 family protein [Fictibacillus macauensis]EIT87214.1 hypothetical protein A374_01414 [Fictibacillus macauensis ZFHKF-1]